MSAFQSQISTKKAKETENQKTEVKILETQIQQMKDENMINSGRYEDKIEELKN